MILTISEKMLNYKDDPEDAFGPASPFDPAEMDDLWFLPEPDEDDTPELAPLPRADRRQLFDPAEWGRTQADLSCELAALCLNPLSQNSCRQHYF